MTPNIFDIATKELSQDAFLTWLLQWADDSNKLADENLNLCAKRFVQKLLAKQGINIDIQKVIAGRQWENIDVWAEVNDKYLIIIEDKTYTNQHSNQLLRYKEVANTWCISEEYILVCIYMKTGNESLSSLQRVEEQGFAIFSREDLINTFNEFLNVKNNIFTDFHNRLVRIEDANRQYINTQIGKWTGMDWEGFYQYLDKKIKLVNWHYVNNPAGGFWNAVLNWEQWGDYPAYLQIEQGKLCFKVSTHPEDIDIHQDDFDRGEVRNELCNLVVSKAKEVGLTEIRRPDRFGNGKYMTAAIVDKENWLGKDSEIADLELIAEKLNKYKDFLRSII